jgi:hypothetical protein
MSNPAKIDALTQPALSCLHVLWGAALDAAGGDFGFSGEAYDDWKREFPQGTQAEFAGLYGSLVRQGLIYSDDEAEVNGKLLGESQYSFSDDILDYLWRVQG